MKTHKKILIGLALATLSIIFNAVLPVETSAYSGASIDYGDNVYFAIGSRPSAHYGRSIPPANSSNPNTCYGGSIIVLDRLNASTGTVYKISKSISNFGALNTKANVPNASNCWLQDLGQKISVDGRGNATKVTPPDEDPDKDVTCESLSSNPATWIICPLFQIADNTASFLLGLFEDLLSFRVDNRYDKSVKPAWSAIKNIVSALVVIVMLVMIFAQAASFGPFDAYTIRKLLPKIVAAVILIQLSWYIFSWTINVVDDIGRGIMALFDSAFANATGPSGKKVDLNNFWELVNNAGIGLTEVGFISIATVIGAGVAAVVALPLVAMGVFLALVAIAVGVFVLIFRMILILVLLLSAPVALLLWVLPGTEKYWKMWWDNFWKVLFMFPIIILIVEAGRIFAFVGGPAAKEVDPTKVLAFLIVLIGFFGPLFLLPKSFRWGGTFMQAAGERAFKFSGALSERPKKYFQARQETWDEERARRSRERYTKQVGFNKRRPWRRPLDLWRAGQLDPLLAMQGRPRDLAGKMYELAGAESEKKDVDAAVASQQLVIDRLDPDEQDAYARAMAAGQKLKIEGNQIKAKRDAKGNLIINPDGKIEGAVDDEKASLLEERAGLEHTLRLGGEANISYVQSAFERAMKSEDKDRIEMMNKFTTANVQSLFTKLPHLYKNSKYAVPDGDFHDVVRTVEGLTPENLTALSGVGMRTLRNNLVLAADERDRITGELTVKAKQSRAALNTLQDVFKRAATDPTLKGRISPEVVRAMEEMATGEVKYAEGQTGRILTPEEVKKEVVEGEVQRTREGVPIVKVKIKEDEWEVPLNDVREGAAQYGYTETIEEPAVATRPPRTPGHRGTVPPPDTGWRPTGGISTRDGPQEGETRIPHEE